MHKSFFIYLVKYKNEDVRGVFDVHYHSLPTAIGKVATDAIARRYEELIDLNLDPQVLQQQLAETGETINRLFDYGLVGQELENGKDLNQGQSITVSISDGGVAYTIKRVEIGKNIQLSISSMPTSYALKRLDIGQVE